MFQDDKGGGSPAVKTGEWRMLAGMIREGCKKYPVQCFGQYKDGPDGACALGATETFRDAFARMGAAHPCPECSMTDSHMGTGYIIQHLNDYHRWTREKIADWLDSL